MPVFFASAQFEDFIMERMSGPEFAHFEFRVGLIAAQPVAQGLFHEDFQTKGSRRQVRVTYYYSKILKQLFVVGGHLLRQGEPNEYDKGLMEAYLDAVHEWEQHPSRRPEAFGEPQKGEA